MIEMNKTSWEVTLCWVKAHAGILGNELADTLAKKAAANESLTKDYKRIPKSVVNRELEEESVRKWRRNWTQTTEGSMTKEYFPNVEERIKMKINLTHKFTAIITEHGKGRVYISQFKIIEEPTCPCGTAEQTTDHLIIEYETITKERERLKTTALQNGSWPTNKKALIRGIIETLQNSSTTSHSTN